jgi:two-component system, NtrC family, sensor histidine kinase KinB
MKTEAERYKLLYNVSRTLHEQHLDLSQTLAVIMAMVSDALSVPHGALLTFSDQTHVAEVHLIGEAQPIIPAISPNIWETMLRQGLVGYVYHSDRAMIVRNIQTDPRWIPVPGEKHFPINGSALSIPLHRGSHRYAVIVLVHPDIDYFTRERVALLEDMAEIASEALANAMELQAARVGDTRYQAVFDGAVVPVVLTDIRGNIVDVNLAACKFLGYSRADLLRVPLADINVLKLDDAQLSELRQHSETSFATTTYNADGDQIPSLVRARMVKLDGRTVIEWVMQDVSAQAELEQLKLDLQAMIFHDLRGPMQAIVGSIYKLGSVLQNHENPAVLRLLQIGLQSTRRMQRMVDSLLDIQRIESGNAILNRQSTEVRVLLTDAIQLVQPLASDSGQHILFEVGKEITTAHIDSDMLMRVLINLIENAIKYTPAEGAIHVSATLEGDSHLIFKVSDSGPGIPADMLARIFEKFSRVQYQDAPKGVGLGLAFCRLAVEAHGGKIWVESELGNGSDFIFRIPLYDPKRRSDDERATQEVKRATA